VLFRSNEGLDYEERQSRLIHFRSLVTASQEVPKRTRVRFLTATYPMVIFSHRSLRILLLFLLRSGALVLLRGIPGQAEFVRRYLPKKKSVGRSVIPSTDNA
jgi:hypothetical protein